MPGTALKRKANLNRLWRRARLFLPIVILARISRIRPNASLPSDRDEFLAWLKRLEYGLYGLPVEDLVVYLRVPAAEAHRLIGLKPARVYTSLRHDILEADVTHLEQTAMIYDRLATETNWVRIDCTNPVSGGLYSPEEIHRVLLNTVDSRILSQASAEQRAGEDFRELL